MIECHLKFRTINIYAPINLYAIQVVTAVMQEDGLIAEYLNEFGDEVFSEDTAVMQA